LSAVARALQSPRFGRVPEWWSERRVHFDQRRKTEAFASWLEAKGDDPSSALTLKWIGEFERYVREDEEMLKEFKHWVKAKGNEPDALSTLREIARFEATLDDEERLEQFKDRLTVKDHDRNVSLALWWIAAFEEAEGPDRPGDSRQRQ
jgi:hypothetical protein